MFKWKVTSVFAGSGGRGYCGELVHISVIAGPFLEFTS